MINESGAYFCYTCRVCNYWDASLAMNHVNIFFNRTFGAVVENNSCLCLLQYNIFILFYLDYLMYVQIYDETN